MQLIECPWCGPREEIEFHYGGQAHVEYPEQPAELDDTEWARYLFFRENTQGPYAERWAHTAGCRRWFNAVRDTVSYRFLAVYKPGEPRPVLSEDALLSPAQRNEEEASNGLAHTSTLQLESENAR